MLQDKTSIMHVLGSLLQNPSLLSETEKYQLEQKDFPEQFHRIIFGVINNLYHSGNTSIDEMDIEGFLKDYLVQYEVYSNNNGIEYVQKIKEIVKPENFDYHYNRVKKFSLIREMDGLGFDIKDIYDDSILNPKENEQMLAKFDKMTLGDILKVYEEKMIDIREQFQASSEYTGGQAGIGIMDLIQRLKEEPDVGLPLNSKSITNITRGARKTKFYIRSSTSGGGKTRNMVADACFLSATEIYDIKQGKWVKNEFSESCNVTSTEMLTEELQSIALAYISGVPEHKIQLNLMTSEETARVEKAGQVMMESRLYFDELPNFSISDIERTLEKNIIKYDVEYFFFDYLHTSISILGEIGGGGVSLREDQILLLMSNSLKDIANKHNVFLLTATQLSSNWEESWRKGEEINANHLQGSKSVINKADVGMIMLEVSPIEREAVKQIVEEQGMGHIEPNMVTHVFKNRGNRYDNVKIFSRLHMGNMRIKDLFVTDYNNQLITVDELNIKSKKKPSDSNKDTQESPTNFDV